MKISNDNITFQSKIKLVGAQEFSAKISSLSKKRHEVGYPWIPESTKVGKKLFTTSISDCIAGMIIKDNNIAMFHLCTRNQKYAKSTHQKGFDIKNIERRFKEKINFECENIHAFIIGGFQFKKNSKYNAGKVNSIKKIFEKNEIPYSEITCRKDTHVFGRYSLLYDNKEDIIYISDTRISDRAFDSIKLENNSVIYKTYTNSPPYESTKRQTGVREFFESQFRNVNLCKFDEFV